MTDLDIGTARHLAFERNDCTVVALAQAFNLSYDDAHKLCEAYGRVPGQGFHISAKLLGHLKDKLMILPQWTEHTVSNAMKFLQSNGTYICLVSGHMFCIKNGKALDGLDNRRKKVIRMFKVVETTNESRTTHNG